jgi:hypothetical protein
MGKNEVSDISKNVILSEPKLAEPGDGLGLLEMFLLRKWVKGFLMRNLTREAALKKMKAGQEALEINLAPFKGQHLTTRVLVPRPWFVEDSSRYWSAAMLFRHVGKVNGALAKAIELKFSLAQETSENSKQRLRAVKPELELNTILEIDNFRNSVERLTKAATFTSVHDLESNIIPHPWLEQLTYLQWIWFMGFHMKVHAKQLNSIYKELSVK